MKKLLILFILLTVFMSGCGIYNLNLFTVPDDIEFLALIQELNTPIKIANYMENNFKYEEHLYYSLDPYQFWKSKKGDCNDYSCFAIFMATQNNYETYQLNIYFTDSPSFHSMAIFKEEYYTFTDCQFYYREYLTIKDIVDYYTNLANRIWTKYIIYDYDMNIIETISKRYPICRLTVQTVSPLPLK